MATEVAPIPLLMDDSGYQVRQSDLDRIGIRNDQLQAMLDWEHPLGMSKETYAGFVGSLFFALKSEGIDVADVRIQGSSVNFFSGLHKCMPYSREEVYALYTKSRTAVELKKHGVSKGELDRIQSVVQIEWPDKGERPKRWMFDLLYTLGITPDKSDYDVQISSDQMYSRLDEYFELLELRPGEMEVDDPAYKCVDSKYVIVAFRQLDLWTEQASDLLGRDVELAVFRSAGPPVTSGRAGMSSRFSSTDWVLQPGGSLSQ